MIQLPIKAHYAALAMLALARRWETRESVAAKVIAGEENIPTPFLLQILQQLRSSGLITSTRGANGGFSLRRSPEQTNLAQVVECICPCSGSQPVESPSGTEGALHSIWQALEQQQRAVLEDATLANLLERATEQPAMFYI